MAKGPHGPRVFLADGSEPPRKSWRVRAKERALGLRTDPPPEEGPNLAKRIPPATKWLRPRYLWELNRWPAWGYRRHYDGRSE
jgi:hypothetical protein